MKVVLFCGGYGLRLREAAPNTPKPLVEIGGRPIIWHLMKYYAYYGHKDFILCLGYRGEAFKDYFLDYQEARSNDFVLTAGGRHIELMSSDIDDWRIHFVDTGLNANVGMRLRAIREHLAGETTFLANYSDGLSDLPLDRYVAWAQEQDRIASFVSVRDNGASHMINVEPDGRVTSIQSFRESGIRINGGFFHFKTSIFDHMGPGEELVVEPFQRLMALQQLVAYRHDGFWQAMDTFKDKQLLDELAERDQMPWQVWKPGQPR